MSTERRKFPRKKPEQLSYINLESENGGMLLDLSEGGVGFHAVTPIDPSVENLRFWFSVKSIDRIDAEGKIVWTDESHKSGGVRFLNLDENSRKKIRAWLRAEQLEDEVSVVAPAAEAPAASSTQPLSNFDAQAEDVISVAEAALGSRVQGSRAPINPSVSAGFGAADLDPLPYDSSFSGVARPLKPVSSVAPSSVVSVATSESARRLKVTAAGIQADRSVNPATTVSTQPRRYSMLFDEGDPDEETVGRHVFAPMPPRQSQMSVVLGTLGVLALLAGGVYTYLYHDRVGAFLESLGSRMTQSRQANPSPQTVAAAPPVATNSVPVSQNNSQSPSTLDPSTAANPAAAGNAANSGTPDASAGSPSATNLNAAPTTSPSQPANSGAATDSSEASNRDAPPKSTADASAAEDSKNSPPTTHANSKLEAKRSSGRQQANSSANRLPTPGEPDEGGAEQLAAARKLLGGSASRSDTSRGVQLLWSAIEKGNLDAEVELADLYVSGVGVPRNCTQARILLQSAAKRDSSEALRRLQDLRRGSCR